MLFYSGSLLLRLLTMRSKLPTQQIKPSLVAFFFKYFYSLTIHPEYKIRSTIPYNKEKTFKCELPKANHYPANKDKKDNDQSPYKTQRVDNLFICHFVASSTLVVSFFSNVTCVVSVSTFVVPALTANTH